MAKQVLTRYRGFKVSYVGPHETGHKRDSVGPTILIEDSFNKTRRTIPYNHALGDYVDSALEYLRGQKIKIIGKVSISPKHEILLTKNFTITLKPE